MLSKQKNIVSLLFPFLKIKAKQKYITSIKVYQILWEIFFLNFLKLDFYVMFLVLKKHNKKIKQSSKMTIL